MTLLKADKDVAKALSPAELEANRPCEERSDEAIPAAAAPCGMDCFAFGSQ